MTTRLTRLSRSVLVLVSVVLGSVWTVPAAAQAPEFHFESICRNDPAERKDVVAVVLHDPIHDPLAGLTVNVLWSYVDYRQNRAVFRYKEARCVTAADGSCIFNGGSGRARWQLSEVVGYQLGDPAFDTSPTAECPNTFMIDFW